MAQLYSIVSCWSKTCFLLLSWLVNKNHNLQGWQIPAGRWNSERERGFPQVAMSCSQNLVQFWRTCHCRGLTMEEARNLLRSCQGEVSSSHCRIIWNIYHQLWITNFYLNSQCPGNYGHHHYFPGGYHHSQRPREGASGTNCAGEFPKFFGSLLKTFKWKGWEEETEEAADDRASTFSSHIRGSASLPYIQLPYKLPELQPYMITHCLLASIASTS